MFELESQIRKWRGHLRSSGSLREQDLEELESHLRDNIDDLTARGITTEEAFLISIRRMGDTEALSDEFAKVTTESIWRQLLVPALDEASRRRQRTEIFLVIGLAILAGLLAKIPALFGWDMNEDNAFIYLKNASLFALPPVAIYLIWKRSLSSALHAAGCNGVRRRCASGQPLSVLRPLPYHRTRRGASAHRPPAARWHPLRRARAGARPARGWTSFGSRARSSSTRCSSPWAERC